MGIDPSDEKCVPFYEKMKELNMVSCLSMRQRYSVFKWQKAGRGLGTRLVTPVFSPSSLSPPSLSPPSFSPFLSSLPFLFSLFFLLNRLYLFTQVMNTQWMQPSLTTVWGIPSSSESETSCDITNRTTVQLHSTPWHHGDIMVTSWDIMVTYWPVTSTTDLWTVEWKWLPLTVQLRYVCACVLERVGVLCGWFGSMHAV